MRQWLTILKDPRLALGLGMLLAGAFGALSVWIAWLVAPKVVPLWPVWPSLGLAVVGFLIALAARPDRPKPQPERPVVPPTNGPQPPPPPPTKRPRRFPTVDDMLHILGHDPSKGATDTTSTASTNDG